KYSLKGPRVDAATLARVAEDVAPVLDAAAAGPAATEPPESAEATPGEGENPLAKKEEVETPALLLERPEWRPWLDASAGYLLGGRNFSFEQSGLPTFTSSVAPAALRLDAAVYPLAIFLGDRAGALANALSGIG